MSNTKLIAYTGELLSLKSNNKYWYIAELTCIEKRKEKEIVHYHYITKFKNYECYIPIPKKMPPTYYGENFSITWYLTIYDQKIKKIYEQELYVLTKTDNLKEEILDFNNFKLKINLNITSNQKIILESDKKIIINSSKIFLKEILDLKFEKEIKILHPKIESTSENIFNLIINEKLPLTFFNRFSALLCELILEIKDQNKTFYAKVNLNIFDKIEEYQDLSLMKKLVLNYIKNYGPMTLGKLVMLISYGEKMRVKSKDVLRACEELIKEKKLIREGYGPLTSKYYLASS
jgi:hypothetical protein